MKSVNYALRAAYVTRLNGLTVNSLPVPVYYQRLPENVTAVNYILITGLNNNNTSTINSADTDTYLQLQIHTAASNSNSGKMADDIAGAVFNLVLPNPQFNLDLSAAGVQLVNTSMSGDQTLEQLDVGNTTFQTRVLTFKHKINHK